MGSAYLIGSALVRAAIYCSRQPSAQWKLSAGCTPFVIFMGLGAERSGITDDLSR